MSTSTGYTDGPQAPLRTLVVDDDPSLVRLLSATLQRRFGQQLDVISTDDPGYVWGLAAETTIHMCLTDMDMPAVNGFKLLKELKQLNPLTQVLFLTAHPTLQAARSAFALGADEFLSKPVNLGDVCACVQYLIERVQRLDRVLLD